MEATLGVTVVVLLAILQTGTFTNWLDYEAGVTLMTNNFNLKTKQLKPTILEDMTINTRTALPYFDILLAVICISLY